MKPVQKNSMKSNLVNHKLVGFLALFFTLAIVLGAFGAHGLKGKIPSNELDAYKTGILYHLIMTLFALFASQFVKPKMVSGIVAGTFVFSFSIYAASLLTLNNISVPTILRIATPVGGSLMIIFSLLCSYSFLTSQSVKSE